MFSNCYLPMFPFNTFCLPKKKSKGSKRKVKNSNPHGFQLHGLSIQGTKVLYEEMKAIIMYTCIYMYIYIYVYLLIYIYMYVCTYI